MLFGYLSKLRLVKLISSLNSRMISNRCDIAVCQFTATNSKSENLITVKTLVEEAASKNAKVIFLPEACDFIGIDKEETKALSESLDGVLMSEYRKLAKTNAVWLSIGGFHEKPQDNPNGEKICNAHVLIDDQGNIKSVYRKLHLFDSHISKGDIKLRESDNVIKGSSIVPPVSTPAGSIGLCICYDVRFPELSTLLSKQGASILTYPSAFTHVTGEAHWEVLLRSRAIENQCYVVAAAQYGRHNEKRISHGRSMIINPWGEIIAECPGYDSETPSNQSIAVASVDSGLIASIREQMPVFQHRRSDIYDLRMLDNSAVPIEDSEKYMFSDKVIPDSTVFYKSRYCFAFTNIRCVVPGHVLVSTLMPAKRIENLTDDQVSDLFQTATKVQKVLEKVHSATASTLCVQDGQDAGQTVPHVHVHILPRRHGDFEKNDEIYDRLAKHDREGTSTPLRSLEEMSEEASELRKYFYCS